MLQNSFAKYLLLQDNPTPKDSTKMAGASYYNSSYGNFKAGTHYRGANDDEGAVWTMLKRIKDSLQDVNTRSDMPDDIKKLFGEIQRQFRHKVKIMPYKQLLDEHHINQLLDDYLSLLIIGNENQEEIVRQYRAEREYYYTNPSGVRNVAVHLKDFITQQC
jgi:hypothetical protein